MPKDYYDWLKFNIFLDSFFIFKLPSPKYNAHTEFKNPNARG